MNISGKGIMQLLKSEGLVVSPYLDSVWVWTYGVGHTAAAGKPDPEKMPRGPIAADEMDDAIKAALNVYQSDLEKYSSDVRRAFARPLTQEQFDAAVSFHVNTGGIGRATWVKLWNSGEDAKARRSFMNWRKPPEIIPRRREERDLFFEGRYSIGPIAIYDADEKGRKKQIGSYPANAVLGIMRRTPFPAYTNSMPLDETAPKTHPYPQDDAPPLPDPVAISETLKPRGASPQIPPTARPDQPARPALSPAGATKRGGLIALFVAGVAGIAAWAAGLLCNVPWLAEFLGVGCGG